MEILANVVVETEGIKRERQMKRGIIVVNGDVGEILEGFTKKEVIQNPQINGEYHIGKYALYTGDETVRGKAQLWIKQ